MNIFINILGALFCLIIGYFFGSIPTAIWIGRAFFHQDPRDYGSHNAGGTNAGRLWGKKVGFLVIAIDMLKAVVPMWLCWALFTFIPFDGGQGLCAPATNVDAFGFNSSFVIPYPVYWLATIGCMVGHCWSCFSEFNGGKGVAVFMGIVVCSSWMIGFIPSLFYFAYLKATKHVSFAGIMTSVGCSLVAWIWAILCMAGVVPSNLYSLPMYGPTLLPSWIFASILTVLTIIIIIRHKENIKRLLAGTERKITWMK